MDQQEQKLRELVSAYQAELLRFCYVRLQDRMQAEDAVQETFLKVYNALPDYRDDGHEKAWVYRIALNVCVQAGSDGSTGMSHRSFFRMKVHHPTMTRFL